MEDKRISDKEISRVVGGVNTGSDQINIMQMVCPKCEEVINFVPGAKSVVCPKGHVNIING